MARNKGKVGKGQYGPGTYENITGSAWLRMSSGQASKTGKGKKGFDKKYYICEICGANLPAPREKGTVLCPRCMRPMVPM
jgi:hypothetical protein